MKQLLCLAWFTGMAFASHADTLSAGKFAIHGYGTMNYFMFDWQTDPQKRNAIDLERLTLYTSYGITNKISLLGEFEFEHGGTGVTMEFDKFEEFGEFETEVEKGGEVKLEQMFIDFRIAPVFNLKIGRFKLPIGLNSQMDEPSEYFTTTRSEMESAIIPTNWYENGTAVYGQFGPRLKYSAAVVNGLDASGFSSSNWIVRGYQQRFETTNAEDLAFTGRLDYEWGYESFAGVSVYYGNSANNRPKPDLTVDAHVRIVEAHAAFESEPLIGRAIVIHGHLQNSDKVSDANRNLSNNLNVKRSPVGSEAFGYSAEIGLEIFDLFHHVGVDHPAGELILFGRFESYDTMYKTEGAIFNNPRWDRSVFTVGANYQPIAKFVVFKSQYSRRRLGIHQSENTFSLGMGFEF